MTEQQDALKRALRQAAEDCLEDRSLCGCEQCVAHWTKIIERALSAVPLCTVKEHEGLRENDRKWDALFVGMRDRAEAAERALAEARAERDKARQMWEDRAQVHKFETARADKAEAQRDAAQAELGRAREALKEIKTIAYNLRGGSWIYSAALAALAPAAPPSPEEKQKADHAFVDDDKCAYGTSAHRGCLRPRREHPRSRLEREVDCGGPEDECHGDVPCRKHCDIRWRHAVQKLTVRTAERNESRDQHKADLSRLKDSLHRESMLREALEEVRVFAESERERRFTPPSAWERIRRVVREALQGGL
jgi:hypothetical protein